MQDADHDGAAPDAAQTEPTQVEPKTESSQIETGQSESNPSDAPRNEPSLIEPNQPEPSQAEAGQSEPAPSAPLQEEPDRAEKTPDEANLVETAQVEATPSAPSQAESDRPASPEEGFPLASLESLPPRLRTSVAAMGWDKLMPVQERAVPFLLAGRDVMVQSRTGSGKTGAFLLPILDKIDPDLPACQALILAPTRELAAQVAKDAEIMGSAIGVRSVAVYGGVGYGPQIEAFRQGAHIVVGAPGRILDHLLRGTLSLKQVRFLVFDEADRMLSIGFYPDMKAIQRHLPRELQGCMFSATFPQYVLRLADEFLRRPEFISMAGPQHHVAETVHTYSVVSSLEKDRCLMRYIELENPSSAIIFCNTRSNVHYVTAVLQGFGYDADEISSDLAQGKREATLDRVREGKLRFLVATDVAARGIDIQELSHVFLYDQPEDPESYVHRAGRTGRAGASGIVISLVDVMEELKLQKIGKQFTIPMEKREPPSEEEVQSVVAVRVTALLEARLRALKSLQIERLRRFVPLVRSLGQSDEESALLALLLDEYYQETLHAAPPQPAAPAPVRESRESREARDVRDGRESRESREDFGGRAEGPRRNRNRRDRRRPDEYAPGSVASRGAGQRTAGAAIEPARTSEAPPSVPEKPAQAMPQGDAPEPEGESFESGPLEAEGQQGGVQGEERKKRRRRRRRRGGQNAQTAARSEEDGLAEKPEEGSPEDSLKERPEADVAPSMTGERREGRPEAPVGARREAEAQVEVEAEVRPDNRPEDAIGHPGSLSGAAPDAFKEAETTPPAADEQDGAKPRGRAAGRSRSRAKGKARGVAKEAPDQTAPSPLPSESESKAKPAPKESPKSRSKAPSAGRPEAKTEPREPKVTEDVDIVEIQPAAPAKPKRSIFGLNEPYTGDDEEDEDIDI